MDSELVVRLARRKILPQGSTLRRGCSCERAKAMCPVHVLGTWLAEGDGRKPFSHFSANYARAELKRRIALAGCAEPEQYTLHDMRRGHAQDLVENGGSLQQILSAGQWSSPAFLKYIDSAKADRDVVVEATLLESDSDEG